MTRITITLAALAAIAAAAPAAAQYGGRYDTYASGDVDIAGLGAEIDAGVSRGDISTQQAWTLRSQLRGLVNLQRQYAQDGLSASERNDLQQRAQGLRNEIAQGGGYATGYGSSTYGNGYANRGYAGQYSQYDRSYRADPRYDRDDDGDDRYGDDEVVLRVGDRAPDGLYGVPDEYRARFRDGPTFYYRYGAGNIYQIDARNGVVARVIRVDR